MSNNNNNNNNNKNDDEQQQSQQPPSPAAPSNKSSKSAMTTLGYLRAAREWAYPTLKKTAFLEKGVLTPDEFVKAGDELVFKCPTWSWEAGDPLKAKSYLPAHKQYLITRNVPCQTRVAAYQQNVSLDEEDDWLVSHMINNNEDENNSTAIEEEFDILDEMGEVVEKKPAASDIAQQEQQQQQEEEDDDEEYADMADFEDDNVLSDDAIATTTTTATAAAAAITKDNLLKVRTYDLSITYDKYYQTPRIWMVGKSATGQPLSGDEMMQDVITDYANKTVTVEGHPHVAGPHASIHPCQHAKVMKTIVRNLIKQSSSSTSASGGGEGEQETVQSTSAPSVELYLFIFLKFVSSIIPTINYDFTMDVTASTAKIE